MVLKKLSGVFAIAVAVSSTVSVADPGPNISAGNLVIDSSNRTLQIGAIPARSAIRKWSQKW